MASLGSWTAALLLLGACAAREQEDWKTLKEAIRERFPEVTQISTERLERWLDSGALPRPVLLDVREPEEYAVSHLANARRASTEAEALAELSGLRRDHPIVLYCSVGYRSSELAQRLQEEGFENVRNLEGSIFLWANEGRPVYRDGRKVDVVHPYDEEWGRLLDKRLWPADW